MQPDGIAEVDGQIVRFHEGRPEAICAEADGKVVEASRTFSVRMADDDPFEVSALGLAEDNEQDAVVLAFVATAEVGEWIALGGGAMTRCELRRIN